MSDIPREHCDMCGDEMKPVFNGGEGMRLKGWVCIECMNWVEAIYRERRYEWSEEWDKPASQTNSVGH
jgi:hypothetical protein